MKSKAHKLAEKDQFYMLLFLFLKKVSSETIEFSDGILKYNLFYNQTASVLGRAKNEKIINLKIPQNVEYKGDKYTVISIADSSFTNNATFGTLTLPDSLQYIGKEAFMIEFRYQTSDKQIGITGELIIPASITEIGPYAFFNTSITSLKISSANKITKISEFTFSYCPISGEVVLPESIEEIENNSFMSTHISKINFPSSLKTIGMSAFLSSTISCDIIIPESVTEIGPYAFFNTSIKSLKILSNKITKISNRAFARSTLSGEVVLPESIEEIEDRAFWNTNITKINFPPSLEIIGEWAFGINPDTNNTGRGLSCDIIIPDSVTEIGVYAFYNTSIKSLKISSASNITIIDYATFAFSTVSGEVVLPESIEEIEDSAFWNTNITKINFPSSLKRIGHWAFGIDIRTTNTGRGLSCDITISDSITEIGFAAFYNTSITSLKIGNSITEINGYSFA